MREGNEVSNWSGALALIIFLLLSLGALWIEGQIFAARAGFAVVLGTPALGHLYWPWRDLQWMLRFDFFGASENVNPWVHAWFAAQRSQLGWAMILAAVLGLVLQFFVGRGADARAHGTSEWATTHDLRRSSLSGNRDGIVLGQTSRGDLLIHNDTANVLVIGPPGAGKSDGIAVPTLIKSWPYWSAIVFDPAGELAERTASVRERDTRVVRFDPRDSSSACFNPLAGIAVGDVDSVRSIVAAYMLDRDLAEMSEQEQFFAASALELATAVVAHVMELGTPTFAHAVHYYYNVSWESDKTFCESLLKSEIPYVAETGAKFSRMTDKQLSPIVATFSQKFELFRSPNVARAVAVAGFTAADLRSAPTTLYLTVREYDQAALNPLMRMVLTRLLDDLTIEVPREGQQPILLLVDEFPLLRAPVIARKLATMRKYLIRVALLAQSYTQVRQYYGLNETISGLCDVRVFFPSVDVATQDLASRACGQATRWGQAMTTTASGGSSQSSHETGRPLLLPQELAEMAATGEIVVSVKGERPIRARPVRSHADRRFTTIQREQ